MSTKDPDKIRAQSRKYYYNHREKLLIDQKRFRIARRMKVINHYGGKCSCCEESQYEFLSIEHDNGGGTQHRKSLSSPNIDRWILKNNYPDGFSILCHNCNFAKGIYGECPHQKQSVV